MHERPHPYVAYLAAQRPERARLDQERARVGLLLPEGQEQHDRRASNGAQRTRSTSNRSAVDVAPLRVVDGKHERLPCGEGEQQSPQRHDGPTARNRGALGFGQVRGPDVIADPTEDGKEPLQVREVGRQRGGPVLAREVDDVCAECVDHDIECHVRNGFPLVRAPVQSHPFAPGSHPLEEVPDQLGLAHPGASPQAHGDEAPLARRLERVVEQAQMLVASHERVAIGWPGRRSSGRRRARRIVARRVEHPPQGGAVRTRPRVGPQQRAANGSPGPRVRAVDEVARGRRLDEALAHHQVLIAPGERRTSHERLVEHHSDAVPVAGRRRGDVGRLLRRHVPRGADHLPLALVLSGGHVGRRTEVEQHQAAFGCDEHVGWLDVPMKFARGVKGADPGDELPERRADAIDLREGRSPLHPARRGSTGPLDGAFLA